MSCPGESHGTEKRAALRERRGETSGPGQAAADQEASGDRLVRALCVQEGVTMKTVGLGRRCWGR